MEVVALTTLPIGFVQPIIAAGVLLLPPLAHVLGHERLASTVVGGIALIIIGVVALSFDGPRATAAVPATPIGVVVGLTVGCLVLFALGRWSRRPGISAAIAGVGYAGTGIITRILASQGDIAAVSLVIPLCAAAIVAFLAETSALQGLPATRVGPVVLALGTTLPVLCGRLALGERWPDPLLTVTSLACIVLGGAGVLHFVEFDKSKTEEFGAIR